MLHDLIKVIVRNLRILCLTENPDSSRMWGYYADGMRGVCIGYEFKGLEIREVDYKSEPPRFNIHDILVKENDEIEKVFTTKSLEWKHEQECRGIEESREFFNLTESSHITEIIFGFRCEIDDAKAVYNSAASGQNKPIAVGIAVPKISSYDIEIEYFDGLNSLLNGLERIKEDARDYYFAAINKRIKELEISISHDRIE